LILLRLNRRALLPTIWLPHNEWRWRFANNPAELARVLDRSARTVIQDLGGFGSLISQAAWIDQGTKVCNNCGVEKSILDFHPARGERFPASTRGECKDCTSILERDRLAGVRSVGA
jgi:hypothetical protein